MHDACRPLAAHNIYSALTGVVCRPNLVSLRSAAQTARHRVRVRDRVDIRGILLVGGDIGRIIIAAEPRRGLIAVRRRIVAIVPKRIIAAVPRRVAPHHHRRAPMLEMGQGCRTDARDRHDLSRRRNRRPDHRRRCHDLSRRRDRRPAHAAYDERYALLVFSDYVARAPDEFEIALRALNAGQAEQLRRNFRQGDFQSISEWVQAVQKEVASVLLPAAARDSSPEVSIFQEAAFFTTEVIKDEVVRRSAPRAIRRDDQDAVGGLPR